MDETIFRENIDKYQTEYIQKLLGLIDVEFICSKTGNSLYYTIPLIERLFLEVLKCIPDADIEQLTQGKMRSINSLLDNNDVRSIFDDKVIAIIEKYYKDNWDEKSLRNKLFDIDGSTSYKITIVFEELYFVIISLLTKLEEKIEENKNYRFIPIEEIK